MPLVHFSPANRSVNVEVGTALLDAAIKAGVHLEAPCGGEGACGQCRVQVEAGSVESVRRGCLTEEEIARGVVLACSSRIVAEVSLRLPDPSPSGRAEGDRQDNRIVTDATGHPIARPESTVEPLAVKQFLKLDPPTSDNSLSDMERLTRAIRDSSQHVGRHGGRPLPETTYASLNVLRGLAANLRAKDHEVTVTITPAAGQATEVLRVEPGDTTSQQFGLAIDVGTTTCAIRLIDLASGRIIATGADYNGQLSRGADVISRINYGRIPERAEELRQLVLGTLNTIITTLCNDHGVSPEQIDNAVIVGNTTMIHLLLGLPPEYIRLAPYTPTINCPPALKAREVGLGMYANGIVMFAPGVGSYVGGDITAGLLQTAMADEGGDVRLFLDFGTNGEVVAGNGEWLMACAASAGPAFEGSGVSCGMRAMVGAIESVRIDPKSLQPTISVIGGGRPQGICGSGLVDLMAELSSAGLIDPSGKLDRPRGGDRVRQAGDSGRNLAYTVVSASETRTGKPIKIDEHDIANLLRTKAAVYSACALMLKSAGLDFDAVAEVYVAGGFGRYLNLERSIGIGLLPDLPLERFTYLGNSALTGAHAMLCHADAREKVSRLADNVTYLELNTDPSYMAEYTAALFLPHTNLDRFPTVQRKIGERPGLR